MLGTAAYMSPEQAAGKAVDKRSDLWAFGVVLLEMLSGRQVFKGETVSHVMAAVLKDEPNWAELPHETPAANAPTTTVAFTSQIGTTAQIPPFDVTPDGQRFIVSAVVRRDDPSLHVLLNWPALLTAKVAP